ncbi:MAG: DNA gyrase C-terminal beta-propeller domain-containing protein, partial [Candidatus Methanomethylophilaceae archaeon]
GYGKISVVDDYRKTHRGSKGVITIKTTERNGKVIGVRKVAASDELMVTSKQGKMIRIRVTDIRVTGRNAAGVRLMDMRNDDKITALQPIANEEEVENAKVTDEIIDENVTYNGEPEDEGSDETHESE